VASLLLWLFSCLRDRASRRSLVFWVALLSLGYTFCFMGLKALPYIYYSRWSSFDSRSDDLSGMWIDNWSRNDDPAQIVAPVKKLNPKLLLVAGTDLENLASPLRDLGFGYIVNVDPVRQSSVIIASTLPFLPERITNLGVNSWPGGVFSLGLSDGAEIQLGVIALKRSSDQESFERNRVTARRLSSIMRDSDKARLVVGQFNATPFSQFVAVYSEQARMNSLMFGRMSLGTLNALASKDISSTNFIRIEIPGRSGDAFWFQLRMPVTEPRYKKLS